jgi:hypothetical protein
MKKLTRAERDHFDDLLAAFAAADSPGSPVKLALMRSLLDGDTEVAVIVTVNEDVDGQEVGVVPHAILVDCDLFDRLTPPPEGGEMDDDAGVHAGA